MKAEVSITSPTMVDICDLKVSVPSSHLVFSVARLASNALLRSTCKHDASNNYTFIFKFPMVKEKDPIQKFSLLTLSSTCCKSLLILLASLISTAYSSLYCAILSSNSCIILSISSPWRMMLEAQKQMQLLYLHLRVFGLSLKNFQFITKWINTSQNISISNLCITIFCSYLHCIVVPAQLPTVLKDHRPYWRGSSSQTSNWDHLGIPSASFP